MNFQICSASRGEIVDRTFRQLERLVSQARIFDRMTMIDLDAVNCFRSRWLVRATEAGNVQPRRICLGKVNWNCVIVSMARPQEKQAIAQSKKFYSKLRLS
jgi:hypothetical protein